MQGSIHQNLSLPLELKDWGGRVVETHPLILRTSAALHSGVTLAVLRGLYGTGDQTGIS